LAGAQDITDTAGNALQAGEPTTDETYNIQNDTDGPTVSIAAPSEARGSFVVTFTFSEAVTGFDDAAIDIIATNASVGEISATSTTVYTANITPSSSVSTSTITIEVPASVAVDAAGNPNSAATKVSVAFINEEKVRERTTRVIKNFVSRRANQITSNELDLTRRLLVGGGAAASGGTSATFTGEGDVHNNRMAFATSLRQALAYGQQAKVERGRELGKAMSLGTTSVSGAMTPPAGFDIWARAKWSRFDNGNNEGEFGLLFLGADYRFESGLVVGMMASLDWTDEEDETNSFTAEGKGWMAGPYIVSRLHQNLIFDGRLAYGRSDNKVSPFGTYTDSYDGTRWMAAGRFTGDFKFSGLTFAPHVGVIYFQEKQESYIDSQSVAIPSQRVKLGRLTFGPKVSTNMQMKDGTTISPYLGIKGIWDFKTAKEVDLTTGLTASGSDDFRARVDGGLSVRLPNSMMLTGEGFFDGIGAGDYDAYGGSITIRMPLQSIESSATMQFGLTDTANAESRGMQAAHEFTMIDDGSLGNHAGKGSTPKTAASER